MVSHEKIHWSAVSGGEVLQDTETLILEAPMSRILVFNIGLLLECRGVVVVASNYIKGRVEFRNHEGIKYRAHAVMTRLSGHAYTIIPTSEHCEAANFRQFHIYYSNIRFVSHLKKY